MSQQSFLSRLSGPYLVFTHFVILALAGLTLSRLALMLWQWERVQAAGNPAWMLVQGVRADLILLGLLLAMPSTAGAACWRSRAGKYCGAALVMSGA